MKFFADTANLEEIAYCFSVGVSDGITTNPKIIETTGDLSKGFEGACKEILGRYPNVPVSLETDLRGIDVSRLGSTPPNQVRDVLLEQAKKLYALADNVVVKIPICKGGLMAARVLADQGIKTNITACMTPEQAIEAASAGNGYVSLFANRMLDYHLLNLAGIDALSAIESKPGVLKELLQTIDSEYTPKAWERVLEEISFVARLLEGNRRVSLIVGSIRSPKDIERLCQAGPQIITIPTKIVRGLEAAGGIEGISALKDSPRTISGTSFIPPGSLDHPMTQYTLEEFEKAADCYRTH